MPDGNQKSGIERLKAQIAELPREEYAKFARETAELGEAIAQAALNLPRVPTPTLSDSLREQAEIERHVQELRASSELRRRPAMGPKAKETGRPGRPKELLEVNGQTVKELCGKTSQQAFANMARISPDNLQRAFKGTATKKTLRGICKAAQVKGIKIKPEQLQKNLPQ